MQSPSKKVNANWIIKLMMMQSPSKKMNAKWIVGLMMQSPSKKMDARCILMMQSPSEKAKAKSIAKLETRKLVSDDFGRGFLLLLQFIHRCEKVKMISEQT